MKSEIKLAPCEKIMYSIRRCELNRSYTPRFEVAAATHRKGDDVIHSRSTPHAIWHHMSAPVCHHLRTRSRAAKLYCRNLVPVSLQMMWYRTTDQREILSHQPCKLRKALQSSMVRQGSPWTRVGQPAIAKSQGS